MSVSITVDIVDNIISFEGPINDISDYHIIELVKNTYKSYKFIIRIDEGRRYRDLSEYFGNDLSWCQVDIIASDDTYQGTGYNGNVRWSTELTNVLVMTYPFWIKTLINFMKNSKW